MSSSSSSLAEIIAQLTSAPDVSQGPMLVRLVWVLLSFSIVVVTLRLCSKLSTARRLYLDDLFMVISLAVGLAHAIMMQIALNNGFGRHIVYIATESLEKLETTMKFGALSLAFGFLPMFGRISFCYTLLFLTRTDAHVNPWPLYIFIVLQAVVNITGVIVFYSQCGSNLDTFWNLEKMLKVNEYCWAPSIQTDYGYFMGSFNTVTDAYLAILPAVLIEHTRLSLKTKIGVALLLCLSVLAMASSIVKTYEAKVLSEVTDFTYNLTGYVVAMCIELNIVMITASIPLLRPLFRRRKARNSDYSIEVPLWNSHILLSSALTSKNHSRTNSVRFASTTSLEQITTFERHPASPGMITVTTEVEISYQNLDAPHVHAALVGLIQGEIANPGLVQR